MFIMYVACIVFLLDGTSLAYLKQDWKGCVLRTEHAGSNGVPEAISARIVNTFQEAHHGELP